MSGFIASIIDPRLGMASTRLAVPSLSAGVGVAALILGGARLWPGVALAALVGVMVLQHQPWLFAIYYSALDAALATLLTFQLLSRLGLSRTFDRWQDPLLLMGAAIVGESLFSALFPIGALVFQWLRPGELTPAAVAVITRPGSATPTMTAAFRVPAGTLVVGRCRRRGGVRAAAGSLLHRFCARCVTTRSRRDSGAWHCLAG